VAPSTGQAGCPFHPSIFWHKGDRDRSSPVTFVLTACIPLSPSLLRQVAPRRPRSCGKSPRGTLAPPIGTWVQRIAGKPPRAALAPFTLPSFSPPIGTRVQRIAGKSLDVRISAWFGRELHPMSGFRRGLAENCGNVRFASGFSREIPLIALFLVHLTEKTVRFRSSLPTARGSSASA